MPLTQNTHKHTHTHTQKEKRKKPHKSCRRHVGNAGDLSEKRKKRRQERVGSVAADPDNLKIAMNQGGKHKVPRA